VLRTAACRLDPFIGLALQLDRLLAQIGLGLGARACLRLTRHAVGKPANLVLGLAAGILGRFVNPAVHLAPESIGLGLLALGRRLGPLLGRDCSLLGLAQPFRQGLEATLGLRRLLPGLRLEMLDGLLGTASHRVTLSLGLRRPRLGLFDRFLQLPELSLDPLLGLRRLLLQLGGGALELLP
jgi:hypothetical protein